MADHSGVSDPISPKADSSSVLDPMHICAQRTKPEKNNKYAKRVGAKTAKKLELDVNSEFVLSPADATT